VKLLLLPLGIDIDQALTFTSSLASR
jgi:hypothetical protein